MSLIYYIVIEMIVLFSLLSCNESSNSLNNTPDWQDDSLVETPVSLKIVGNKLLYANETAQRFQLIDVAELNNPRLVAQMALLGYQYKFYVRGKQYVLLQHSWSAEGSRLTVIQPQPDGHLITRQDFSLPGEVVTSQRRGQFIYVVTSSEITVFKWNAQEQLEIVNKIQLPGLVSVSETAFFPDYLVLSSPTLPNQNDQQIRLVQIFDLSQPNDPLVELPPLLISGYSSEYSLSELSLNIFNKQLRMVYSLGSNTTVASYDLGSPAMALIGEVNLTPGTMDSSSCLGTYFVDNRAFVVTSNEGFCNLWIIDLSNPSLPQIMSKLEISDRVYELSFHENHLLAVVNDNQWVDKETTLPISKVALSWFDVTLPNQPILIDHFVPLAEQATESRLTEAFWEDKPVLLLDWQHAFAVLPVDSVGTETHSYLQRVSLANNKIEAAGRFDSPIPLQQVFAIAPDNFVALGDQMLLTLRWQADQFQQLGQLELADDLTWLKLENGELWAVATNGAHYRLYRYTLPNLELPSQQWTLPKNDYQKLLMDPHWAVFYNYDTTIQLINIFTGQLYPTQTLLEQTENKVFRQPFVYEGWFHLAEQLPSEQQKDQFQWVLHSWNLQNLGETLNRFIPGNPENLFIANGELITQEATSTGQLRLNRLALDIDQVHLLYSDELPCLSSSPVFWNGESIYVNCLKEYKIRPFAPWGPIYDENPITQILELNPGQNFAQEGNWIVDGILGLQAVAPQTILLITEPLLYGRYFFPYCEVYRLIPGQEAQQLLKQLGTCPTSDNFVLTPNQVWMAQGLAGIKEVSW
jgi:hypothetical protein